MKLKRRPLLGPLIRWLVGSLTALLLTLPALEGAGAAPLASAPGDRRHRSLAFEERVAAPSGPPSAGRATMHGFRMRRGTEVVATGPPRKRVGA